MVNAKSALLLHCDKPGISVDDYLSAFYQLSSCMDSLRLIYSNVDRTKGNHKGYYPFEQVRDIIDLARSLDPRPMYRDGSIGSPPSELEKRRVKEGITIVFQSLRHAIQDEAGAMEPDKPTRFDSPIRQEYLYASSWLIFAIE
jgi:hypothetical protein